MGIRKLILQIWSFDRRPQGKQSFGDRGLAQFLSQSGKRKEHTHESRHMAYLPHGGFNRSQVAIFMSLMQRIDRKDESLFHQNL